MSRRNRWKKRLKKLLPVATVTLTLTPFAVWSPSASAFFPPMWPLTPPPTTGTPPTSPPVIVVPPLVPPPFEPPTSPPPVITVPPLAPPPVVVEPPPPNGVPEPATVVSGLIGLAAAAGYGLKRRLKKA